MAEVPRPETFLSSTHLSHHHHHLNDIPCWWWVLGWWVIRAQGLQQIVVASLRPQSPSPPRMSVIWLFFSSHRFFVFCRTSLFYESFFLALNIMLKSWNFVCIVKKAAICICEIVMCIMNKVAMDMSLFYECVFISAGRLSRSRISGVCFIFKNLFFTYNIFWL